MTEFLHGTPNFRVEKEIKNVVTVIAKTNHYWQEHAKELQEQQSD